MKATTKRQPTIREVAKMAQVGIMTVSRVINNHPNVRPGTLKKVNAAIAALGYQKNEAARLLKGQRAMLIGLIVPDLSDSFFATCAHTVQHLARSNGYMTLVAASDRDPELEIQQAELMAARKISGLLIATSETGEQERLRQLQNTDLPMVALDRPLPGVRTDAVVVENRAGAEEAVRHLIQHGHRRIACIGYDEDFYPVRERIEGYLSAIRAAGLSPITAFGIRTADDVREWVRNASRLKECPTAIFSLNHRTSTFLLEVLSAFGIAIPDDLALIGFDDFDLAGVVNPPLTTVRQSPAELARRSMGMLLDRIARRQNGTELAPAWIVLPVSLTIRGSCGCRPSGSDAVRGFEWRRSQDLRGRGGRRAHRT